MNCCCRQYALSSVGRRLGRWLLPGARRSLNGFASTFRLPLASPRATRLGVFFSMLDAKQFENCFLRWISGLCPAIEGQHIAIDGKCVRGSHDGKKKRDSPYVSLEQRNRADAGTGQDSSQKQ